MKKYFVSSDIHSFYDIWMEELIKKGFDINNNNHYIIVCGDLADRGDQTKECFDFMKYLGDRAIYVKGNHESLLRDCYNDILKGGPINSNHFHNKTVKTICQLCDENEWIIYNPSKRKIILDKIGEVLDFIDSKCVNYFELGDYIFVHGWIPSFLYTGDFRNAYESDWERARWANGMDMWRNEDNRINGKTIVCGHWHCSWGHSHIDMKLKEFPQPSHRDFDLSFKPWAKPGIIAIDACTAWSKQVNVIVFEENDNGVVKLLDNL